jgi:hypothetical protein
MTHMNKFNNALWWSPIGQPAMVSHGTEAADSSTTCHPSQEVVAENTRQDGDPSTLETFDTIGMPIVRASLASEGISERVASHITDDGGRSSVSNTGMTHLGLPSVKYLIT